MRLDASKLRHCFLEVFDADGVRLEGVITANTNTGRTTLANLSEYDLDYLHGEGRINEKIRHYHPPLRVYDPQLDMDITDQRQLEFLERSRASAVAAHHRWCLNNLRAELAFDELAWKYGCKLGYPTVRLATQAECCA